MNILEEKTLGDLENFTEKTPEEILYELKKKFEHEGSLRYLKEKKNHEQTQKRLTNAENKINLRDKKRTSFIKKISNILSWTISNIVFLSIVVIFIYVFFPDHFSGMGLRTKTTIIIIALFLTILNFVFGFNLFNVKRYLAKRIETFLQNILP